MTVWLSRKLILAIHDEQLAEHGGGTGILNAGLLDSAPIASNNIAELSCSSSAPPVITICCLPSWISSIAWPIACVALVQAELTV